MKENGITRAFLATDILPDGTCIRFTEQSLFEVVFPGGRTETWNPFLADELQNSQVRPRHIRRG